ncbi:MULTISPECIES: hypothetical protein [unclassified Pseudarthrobacter]|uniref:hypothetical protein n=1 Tax=unclassified Pseudarthrobacter TaxID=2647000 RepID=UPI001131588C|nr:hypothetical protein [Pseudarthrobacter sp. NIBRBAC000502772]QDG66399.1 hypothetical protein NIBR502772_09410 [Pseudarthrobacter sp. NIBRBAC000502772]
MNALWIAVALLVAGFAGWPVTALVFRLARTIDDKADAATKSDRDASAQDPSADVTVDTVSEAPRAGTGQTVDGELTTGGGQAPSDAPQPAPALPAQRILRGGAIIGVLERLGVCVAILTGQPVAIAYIVAIKGLGRFAELKETPVAAERFIIGTLTSMLWAAGTAAVIKVVLLQ